MQQQYWSPTMFTGRLSRSGYLLGILYSFFLPMAVMYVLYFIAANIPGAPASNGELFNEPSILTTVINTIVFIMGALWVLLLVPVLVGLAVRRLHDFNKSGGLSILAFVPVVNIASLLLFVIPGTPGPNDYGNPAVRKDIRTILFGSR